MKSTELTQQAIKDGCKSLGDFVEWSYREGRISALKESAESIARVSEEIVPEFLQDEFEPSSVTMHTNYGEDHENK